jgi:hypothetical protein
MKLISLWKKTANKRSFLKKNSTEKWISLYNKKKDEVLNMLFIIMVIIALIIGRIPVIGKYFKVASTLFHESGHAIMAILTGGKVVKIDLFSDNSGLASTMRRGWFSGLLIAAAGYPSEAITSYVFFFTLKHHWDTYLFYGLVVVVVVNLILWVRNWYGFFWLVVFTGLLALLKYINMAQAFHYFLYFIGSIIFVESIVGSLTILYLSFKQPNDAGDATALKRSTWISSRIWGLLFFLQALYFAYQTILVNFK